MSSDPLSSLALTVVFAAVGLYALYWVIRRAVAAGIRDAAAGSGPTGEDRAL